MDAEFKYLMNLTGASVTTVETFGIANQPITDLGTTVSNGFVVNYPGGSPYSWTLDVGNVGLYLLGPRERAYSTIS